jgi:soluble lytic murein transglycosylase-like protein
VETSSGVKIRQLLIVSAVATATLLVCSIPVRAQISKSVDANGKTVWVNDDSPKPRHGSTISSASAHPTATSSMLTRASLATSFPGSRTSYAEPKPLEHVTLNAEYRAPAEVGLDRIVDDAAQRHNVDPNLVRAVIAQESGWNTRAISRKGAVGLMQLIPETGQKYGARNLFDPAQNVDAGTSYLKSLLERYDGDINMTLAAYNAGENAVDRFGGVPAYAETQNYVQKVGDRYFYGSAHGSTHTGAPPKRPVRKATDAEGHASFSNE